MGVIFSDDFSSYSVGSHMPQGPWLGSGTVGGVYGPPPVSNQHYVNVGDIYAYTTQLNSGIVFCGFAIGFGAFLPGGTILSVSNGNPFDYTQTTRFINVRLEKDFSLSLLGPDGFMIDHTSVLPCNTGTQVGSTTPVVNPYPYFMAGIPGGVVGGPCWAYFQLSWSLNLSGPGTIVANGGLNVNFGQGGTAGSLDTGILPSDTPLGLPVCNMYEFYGGSSNGGNYANIVCCTAGTPLPNPPMPPVYVNARVSQFAIELLTQPATGIAGSANTNARMSQEVIELLTQPHSVNTNARMSQEVIELLAGAIPSTGGVIPQYIKRRNLFSNS